MTRKIYAVGKNRQAKPGESSLMPHAHKQTSWLSAVSDEIDGPTVTAGSQSVMATCRGTAAAVSVCCFWR